MCVFPEEKKEVFVPCGKLGSPYRGKTQQPQEQCYPFLSGFFVCFSCVNKYTWCLTSTETMRIMRDGEKVGKGVRRCGAWEIIYLSLHCHHQNDFCIKVGNDESHFNVS